MIYHINFKTKLINFENNNIYIYILKFSKFISGHLTMVRSLELPDLNVEKLLYLSSGKDCLLLHNLTKNEEEKYFILLNLEMYMFVIQ